MRTFIDEDEPMLMLFREACRRDISPKYVANLLAASDKAAEIAIQPDHQWTSDSIEPLSERELEVLLLIADGASNNEIAKQLVFSVGTVKKHVNNIFIKLDAKSRTQVVAIARQNNLL